MTRSGEKMHGVPVIVGTADGDQVWCYACFNDDDSEKRTLLRWCPNDVENYPYTCENCGVELYHSSQDLPGESR